MLRTGPRDPGSRAPGARGFAGRGRRSLLSRLLVWGASLAIWGAVALVGVIGWYAYDLPDVDGLGALSRRPSVTLIAADGTLLGSYGEVYGETVSVATLPPHLPQAVLAVEDRRFYEHGGIDLRALIRASLANLRAGRIVQGGSTITQQLAKNLFLTPERTIKRKVQEMLLAFWLERRFTKNEILSLYLNRVYLGIGTYGVDAAARHYFGKPATQVDLYEAAMLAGLLKAPSRYNPARHRNSADERTALVLRAMADAGYLTRPQLEQALAEKAQGRAIAGAQARYFGDWVMGQVASYIGRFEGDLTVITTLNPHHQQIAESELARLIDEEGRQRGVAQAAVVVLDPDGAVRAMVGGRDYDASQFNRATQALRQPGSAFKPFVFLAGLEAGLSPDDPITDAPIEVEGWAPKNYADRYYGVVTLREAFARSLNSAAVRITERVGRERVAAVARRLGITSELEVSPSLALGTSEVTLLELTGAYAVFANHGDGVWPYGIEEIRGAGGELLYRRSGGGPGRLVEPRIVDRMTNLMSAVVGWGSGRGANPGRPAAGKTGTSQDSRDAWFIGFTANVVVGVWLGNDDGTPMDEITGGSLPAALWRRVVMRTIEGLPPSPLPGGGVAVADARPQPSGDESFIARILRKLGGGAEPTPSSHVPSGAGQTVRGNEP